jgi:fructan beta-fructosidase
VTGFAGARLVNSFTGGDAATGQLTSPQFAITHDYLSLLVGGGNHAGKLGAELLVGGKAVRSTTGSDSEQLLWQNWDVRDLRGKQARVRIIDHVTDNWGHVLADQITLTNTPKSSYDLQQVLAYRNSPEYYREAYRPQYHFTPERNWMNDPNGLVFFDGEYHLFYQHNPFGNAWGHMSWGHAVSRDLVHWQHLPIAIWEEHGVMIFSGSAVVDHRNTSGFGRDGKPPLVAIYTGHQRGKQAQCLAYSNDRGRTWTKYADNPVLDLNLQDFRDPKVFRHEPSGKWVMVVSLAAEKRLQFYGSKNLKQWELLSEFGPGGVADKPNWECPDLFELPIDGEPGATRWVLEVDMGAGSVAGGSGGEYFVGKFDGEEFRCDHPLNQSQWVDYGRDFYAAVSWSNVSESDGRRLWIGWMNNWQTHLLPTRPWRSAMSIPRSLSLRPVNDRLRLVQRPVAELQSLRGQHLHLDDVSVSGVKINSTAAQMSGNRLEIIADFEPGDADEFGFQLLQGADETTIAGYKVKTGELYVDRSKSGEVGFHDAFAGTYGAPLGTQNGRVRMHIFVDTSSVEILGNDGIVSISSCVFPQPDSDTWQVFARGGTARLVSLDVWKLNSIWHDD